MRALSTTLTLAAAAIAAFPIDATAGRRQADSEGVIVAQSRHGNGAVQGLVRAGRKGYEVQLPSGTWIACRRSCEETLRVETIDYWENEGSLVGGGTAGNECGVFGCLDIGRR
jgi:hypothetical protein